MNKKELFMKDFGLVEKDGGWKSVKKLKKNNAQQTKPYTKWLYNEFQDLHDRNDIYASAYEAIDHRSYFWSKEHKCYIYVAQPYWLNENLHKIVRSLTVFGLSFRILEDYTWHNADGGCTMYAFGS